MASRASKVYSHTLTNNQTGVLSVMYLTAIGYGMVEAGIVIDLADDYDYDYDNGFGDDNIPDHNKLLFAGGFLTTLFWV